MKYFGLLIMVWMMGTASFAQNQNEVQWISFEALSRMMEIHPKKVLLFFHEEGCVYCRKMEQAAFKDRVVVQELNDAYYAVEMDAHTTDTITMGGQKFTNPEAKKSRFPIHQVAAAFIKRKGHPISFPVTVLLDEQFQVIERSFVYLSPQSMREFIRP